jgi:hypothetical protein
VLGYYFFIRSIMSGYSARYEGFSLAVIVGNIVGSSAVIKIIVVLGIVHVAAVLFSRERLKTWQGVFPVIWGLLLVLYISVLAPWGFSNYLLAPLAPFVFGALYPVYKKIDGRFLLYIRGALVVLVLTVVTVVLLPRLADIASVRPLTEFLRSGRSSPVHYFPADSPEAPLRLQELTGQTFVYVPQQRLGVENVASGQGARLVVNRRSHAISLDGLTQGAMIYGDRHWKVVELLSREGHQQVFKVVFPETFLQSLIRGLSRK